MKTRKEINQLVAEALALSETAKDQNVGAQMATCSYVAAQLEVTLDLRDQNTEIISLLQKMVESNKTPHERLSEFNEGSRKHKVHSCATCAGVGRVINPENPHNQVSDHIVKFNYIPCPSCSPLTEVTEA